jgi:hypothetical protein
LLMSRIRDADIMREKQKKKADAAAAAEKK